MIWALANPKIGERDFTRTMLEHDHRLVPEGQMILGGRGCAGRSSSGQRLLSGECSTKLAITEKSKAVSPAGAERRLHLDPFRLRNVVELRFNV